jgi:Na+/H+-dicarboxylate symporter
MNSDDAIDGALWVVVQLALITCLGATALWAWPSGMLTIASVLWTLLSLAIWIAALGWLYFLVAPLFKRDGSPFVN